MQPHRYIFNLQLTAAGTVHGERGGGVPGLGFAFGLPFGSAWARARANINIDSINYKNIKCRATNVIKRIKQLHRVCRNSHWKCNPTTGPVAAPTEGPGPTLLMQSDKHVFNSRGRWQVAGGGRRAAGGRRSTACRDKVLHFGPRPWLDYASRQVGKRGRWGGGEAHINDEIIVSIAFNCCQCKFYANIFRLALDS